MRKTIEQLATEEKKAYFKEWRKANPEKTKKYQNDYWIRKAEQRIKEKKGK